jgi:aspartate racemase
MKRIGIIGGIGPESTIEYYRLLVNGYRKKLKTSDYPDIMIISVNLTELLGYVFTNQPDKLVDFMVDKIERLEKVGVDYIAIASNTPHMVFDRIAERTHTPLISIVEVTCKVISDKKMHKVGLLGTKSTMNKGFYQKTAERYGIEIVIPTTEQQDYIHSKYMSELLFNNIVPETKEQLIRIIRELQEKESIEGLILGGTELPLILKQADFADLEILDTTVIHVESILIRMMES